MEVQLQELIDQIKKQGVDAAEIEAEAVLKSAKEQAEKIISDAQAQAEHILLDAKNETEKMTKASEATIRQAGRNLLISFRESITKELNVIIGESVSAAYSAENLEKLIVSAVDGLIKKTDAEDASVILNETDLKSLEESLLSKLKAKISDGITLKPNDNFDNGFRIAVNNEGVYYDYSADAVVEMLSNYLSPKVTRLLKEAE